MAHRITTLLASVAASLAVAACAPTTTPTAVCEGAKCDTPGGSAEEECQREAAGDQEKFQACRDRLALEHCEARGAEAMRSAQRAFTETAIRWACSDVSGVNTNGRDDRGQEYCEYFAVVQPPPAEAGGELPKAAELGLACNKDGECDVPGQECNPTTRTCKPPGSPDGLTLELTDDQLTALEDQFDDDPSAVIGQCVFTSWHADVSPPYPVCDGEDCQSFSTGEATRASWMPSDDLGVPLDSNYTRMKVSINSNGAASDLVQQCMTDPPAGDPEDKDDPLHEDYMRGCWKAYQTFKTEWRRSNPSVCAVGVRLSECGCGVDTDADGVADITDLAQIARAIVPPQPQDGEVTLRGFPLGTWSGQDQLPSGCRHVDTGDGSQTLVTCDLSVGDFMASPDVKQTCREKYGDNVVVHVPIPSGAVVCSPPRGGQYTDSCGDMPWILGQEGTDPMTCEQPGDDEPVCGETCCKMCIAGKACGNACIAEDLECEQPAGCACDAPAP